MLSEAILEKLYASARQKSGARQIGRLPKAAARAPVSIKSKLLPNVAF